MSWLPGTLLPPSFALDRRRRRLRLGGPTTLRGEPMSLPAFPDPCWGALACGGSMRREGSPGSPTPARRFDISGLSGLAPSDEADEDGDG